MLNLFEEHPFIHYNFSNHYIISRLCELPLNADKNEIPTSSYKKNDTACWL